MELQVIKAWLTSWAGSMRARLPIRITNAQLEKSLESWEAELPDEDLLGSVEALPEEELIRWGEEVRSQFPTLTPEEDMEATRLALARLAVIMHAELIAVDAVACSRCHTKRPRRTIDEPSFYPPYECAQAWMSWHYPRDWSKPSQAPRGCDLLRWRREVLLWRLSGGWWRLLRDRRALERRHPD
ncbi:hypothetical protein ACFQ61_08160 [Streptomyces sp. NPDC056500]|uniref:hypothetical protein n=1 Tax=Streptomyces sp. NPDC056500 TaxID=3345840 RepID=UPI003690C7DA